jgi:hypothetical protein
MSAGKRVPLRIWTNTAFGGARERLRASGLTGDVRSPEDRSRAGALLVLCAWAIFVVGGIAIQKLSEHWQAATPAGSRDVPRVAFDVLVGASALGSILVLAGVACGLPALLACLRGGGWVVLRRPIVRATIATGLAVVATLGLAVWAHSLTSGQRNGHDLLYSSAFIGWALTMLAALACWTAAAARAGTHVVLSRRILAVEAWLAIGASLTMLVMSAATIVWWAALARSAPWFFAGRAPGSAASALVPTVAAAVVFMLIASSLGGAGAVRAYRSRPTRA